MTGSDISTPPQTPGPSATGCAAPLKASSLASLPPEERSRILATLDPDELAFLEHHFPFWAHPHQLAPEGDWRTWVILGGRGAGKTRAGAEWVRSMAEGPTPEMPGRARRIALVGETLDAAREIMVHGDSGLLAIAPPDQRPDWSATRRMLTWPNGATAQVFSASDPESLRGPQFDAAWCDELAKWRYAEDTWDMLQFGLRLGDDPRACVTTTPRNQALLRALLERDSTVRCHAPTSANAAFLAPTFMAEMQARYGGTHLGRQELDGLLLDDVQDPLWDMRQVSDLLVSETPPFDRIVVAVDPPVTGHAGSDECGILVVGVVQHGEPTAWTAVVIEDASLGASAPAAWAAAAIDALHRHEAATIVAEVNQGGDMVRTIIQQIDGSVPVKAVRAKTNKQSRAEPVAMLYQQRRVRHVRGLTRLEEQMGLMTRRGYQGKGSPDRLDALVWALTDLIVEPSRVRSAPRMRRV